MNRVVITGMGIVSPLGNTCGEFFARLVAGRSGVRRMTRINDPRLPPTLAAEVEFHAENYFPKKTARSLDRASQFVLAASAQAWADASSPQLDEAAQQRAGVYLGTSMGGATSLDDSYASLYQEHVSRLHPFTILLGMSNAPAAHVSIAHKLKGPCQTFSSACSSSTLAVGEAFRLIKQGGADLVLAGGTEAMITFGLLMGWHSLGTLAKVTEDPATACKPFDKERSGFVLGEGAAMLVLESRDHAKRRGARIHAEVLGYGATADACHITKPDRDGQARAMQAAMTEAGLSSDQIDYINAHGTATQANDFTETQAIKQVFGAQAGRIPISSTKSMHGHLLGAAGAVELVATIMAMQHQTLPPTINLTTPDPECDLDYVPNQARAGVVIKTVMSNSFAFGGSNAVLIVGKNA
jgi:3-oxoacyl-[acyl-carrier-protein] synthase II